MKIKITKPYVIEGQIIEEGVSLRINEKIFGNMASAYHRTEISDLVNKVYTSGFKPGSGDMYGRGFYSTYDLESQERESMGRYGDIIVKFFVPIENFFVFDRIEFEKSPLSRKLNLKDYSEHGEYSYLYAQADHFSLNNLSSGIELYEKKGKKYTSDIAKVMFNDNNRDNIRKVQGIIFTGRNDGKVLVCYETDILIPQSYKIDGEDEFKKVERNMDYLRKVVQRKVSDFTPRESELDYILKAEKMTPELSQDIMEMLENEDTFGFQVTEVRDNFDCILPLKYNYDELSSDPNEAELVKAISSGSLPLDYVYDAVYGDESDRYIYEDSYSSITTENIQRLKSIIEEKTESSLEISYDVLSSYDKLYSLLEEYDEEEFFEDELMLAFKVSSLEGFQSSVLKTLEGSYETIIEVYLDWKYDEDEKEVIIPKEALNSLLLEYEDGILTDQPINIFEDQDLTISSDSVDASLFSFDEEDFNRSLKSELEDLL